MNYEVIADKLTQDTFRAEAINHTGEGECYIAIFSGPDSESRAREYAKWKNQIGSIEIPTSKIRAAYAQRWPLSLPTEEQIEGILHVIEVLTPAGQTNVPQMGQSPLPESPVRFQHNGFEHEVDRNAVGETILTRLCLKTQACPIISFSTQKIGSIPNSCVSWMRTTRL